MSDRILQAGQQIATTFRRRWRSLVRPSVGTPVEPRGPSISPSSDDTADRLENNRNAPAVTNTEPAPLVAEPAQPTPAPVPRKRARTRSLSLGRNRITQQPDHTVPNPPLFYGPDVFGPYPRTYVPPMSFAASRARPLVQFEGPVAAAAGRQTAHTLPPLHPLPRQLRARSQGPNPHVPPPPTPAIRPRTPSLDPKRVRRGARSFGSFSAAARMLHQGGPGEEHPVPPLPSGITPAAISRTNTPGPRPERRSNTTGSTAGFTMAGTAAGDGGATRQTIQRNTDVQLDKRRGSNQDQPNDAGDTVPINAALGSGRATPLWGSPTTPGASLRLPATPGSGVRSNTPGRARSPTPDQVALSVPATSTQGKGGARRSEKQKTCHVTVDDREESPLANTPPHSVPTHPSSGAQLHVSQPPRGEAEHDGDDAAGASGMERQRSPNGREMAPRKPAASTSIRPQQHWSLLVEEDDEPPTTTAQESPTAPAPTPQSSFPHAPDQPGAFTPVFASEQAATRPYKASAVQVTPSQYHKDGGTLGRVPAEVKGQEHEDEQAANSEDRGAKALRTLSKSSEKNGPRTDPSVGSDEPLGGIKCTKSDDNDKNDGKTDRKVRPLPNSSSSQRVPTGSWVSTPRTEGVSLPQAEPSTLSPSTPSPTVCSSPARQGSHENYALFASLHVLSTGGRSPGQHPEIDRRPHPQLTTYQARITDDNTFLLPGHGKDSRLGWQPEKTITAAPPRSTATTTPGKRSRRNGMLTGGSEDPAERRTISMASGKTGGSHPRRLRRTTVQIPHARPLDMPLTSNTKGSVSPVSPGLLADLNLADNKLYTSSEIQELNAERERKLSDSPSERLKQHVTAALNAYPSAKRYASDIGSDIDIGSLEACAFAKGAFGEVHRAKMHDGRWVAIKRLRFYTSTQDTNNQKLQKRLLKEISVWSYLEHENVLPLLGLCVVKNELSMVSEFMPNGNLREYIQRKPTVDRYWLAINVCAGLAYLHEHPKHVIHGDLKAVNVVVDANGVPKLMDFGLAQMIRAEDSMILSSCSSSAGGTARWMAPELIVPTPPNTSCCKPNSASDVYALGMTIYEIFSGLYPFASKNDPQAIAAIMQGELPERVPSSVFSEGLWELLLRCWRKDPSERPTARQVLITLNSKEIL